MAFVFPGVVHFTRFDGLHPGWRWSVGPPLTLQSNFFGHVVHHFVPVTAASWLEGDGHAVCVLHRELTRIGTIRIVSS